MITQDNMRLNGRAPIEVFHRYIATGAGVISLNQLADDEWIMEQITVHLSAIPTTAEDLTLWKDSVEGAAYDTILLAFDFATQGVQDLVCNNPFRWTKGDRVRVDFANTDTKTVGVEVMIRQVKAR